MSTQQSGEGDMLFLIVCVRVSVCVLLLSQRGIHITATKNPKCLVLVEKIHKKYDADLTKIGLAFN